MKFKVGDRVVATNDFQFAFAAWYMMAGIIIKGPSISSQRCFGLVSLTSCNLIFVNPFSPSRSQY